MIVSHVENKYLKLLFKSYSKYSTEHLQRMIKTVSKLEKVNILLEIKSRQNKFKTFKNNK